MAGWSPLLFAAGEESPGSTETRCQITSGGGDPRESATERKPPNRASHSARVKGCGKSAPVLQQCGTHGKPHREQNLIGMVGRMLRHCRQVGFRTTIRVGCRRRSATDVPDEWPYSAACRMDRTRLTGHLVLFFCNANTTKAMTSRHRLVLESIPQTAQNRSAYPRSAIDAAKYLSASSCVPTSKFAAV